MALVRRLTIPPQRRGLFARGVAYGETGQAIICGSNHGKVYVFGKSTDEPEILVHAEGKVLLTFHDFEVNSFHRQVV